MHNELAVASNALQTLVNVASEPGLFAVVKQHIAPLLVSLERISKSHSLLVAQFMVNTMQKAENCVLFAKEGATGLLLSVAADAGAEAKDTAMAALTNMVALLKVLECYMLHYMVEFYHIVCLFPRHSRDCSLCPMHSAHSHR